MNTMALWRSTFIVSAMTMLSRVLGLVRDMVLLNVFGAGKDFDTFVVAFRIPNFFRRLFAEGAFSQAFIPVLTEYKTTKLHAEVQILISRVFGCLLMVMSLLTLISMIIAPVILYVYAPGFHNDPAKFDLAVDMFRLTIPYLMFMSLTAFASSILNSYGSFASPAFSPVLLNVAMIAGAWWLAPHMAQPIMALGWAVVVAGVLQLAIQIPELWNKKLLIPPKVDFKHEGVDRILKLMLPALFGVSVTQINLLLNTIWASFMQDGSVSWLYSAERMTELPLGLIGVAIGTVILPSLSVSKAEQDQAKFR
ncbi:murein biosynthesis integral membrane protein MurJ, partial [Acinetobacter guillouiae]